MSAGPVRVNVARASGLVRPTSRYRPRGCRRRSGGAPFHDASLRNVRATPVTAHRLFKVLDT